MIQVVEPLTVHALWPTRRSSRTVCICNWWSLRLLSKVLRVLLRRILLRRLLLILLWRPLLVLLRWLLVVLLGRLLVLALLPAFWLRHGRQGSRRSCLLRLQRLLAIGGVLLR